MAIVTLPMYSNSTVPTPTDFEIDELSFMRSIVRQGKGARAEWRRRFATYPEIPQSHAVQEWDETRGNPNDFGNMPLHGIRDAHRAWLPVEEQAPRYSDDKPIPDFPHGDAGTPSDDTPAPGADDI